jgi:hypothetical protein
VLLVVRLLAMATQGRPGTFEMSHCCGLRSEVVRRVTVGLEQEGVSLVRLEVAAVHLEFVSCRLATQDLVSPIAPLRIRC